MKQTILLTVCLALGVTSTSIAQEGAKQIFEIENLQSKISAHKTVAVLPFDVKVTYRKQPKNFNFEANLEKEKTMSTSVQSSMYTYLLRRASDYSVTFQDVDKTNILLRKAGVYDKLNEATKEELANILGVDAVLSGRFLTEQTKSEAGAIATTILFGSMGSKSGTGSVVLNLNNGTDGELLWRFSKSMDDSILTSTDLLIERMMRKISRNFPYTKQ